MKDVVIIGGGLAGLSAAWRLRDWDIQLLESSDRIGGRIRSEKRGQYWMNWGGHMFAGEGSATAELFQESGTRWIKIPGKLSAMSMNGKFIKTGPVQTYPLRFPMKFGDRVSVIAKGAKVSKDVFRYAKISKPIPGEAPEVRQQRIFDFENERTFAEYVGPMNEDVLAFFKPTVTRSTADVDQLAAGSGIGYFSLIWNIGAGLSRYILGGPSTLTEGVAQAFREHIELNAEVFEVVENSDHVVVRYRKDGKDLEVRARTAILATPAPITKAMAVNLPSELSEALGEIKYGPHVSGAFLTNENSAQVWDDCYGVAVGKKSFIVFLNPGNIVRGTEKYRQAGGSVMTFSSAGLARQLMELSDEEIKAKYLQDLDAVFPRFSDLVVEGEVARWHFGSPYSFPGRSKLQPILTKPTKRIFLAGDYLGTYYTETSISSGFTAAQEARSILGTEHQNGSRTLGGNA